MPPNLLADVYESMVGAIYLDGGLEPAREFILEQLGPEIEAVAEGAARRQLTSRCCSRWPSANSTRRRSTACSTRRAPTTASASRSPRPDRPTHLPAAWGRNKKEAEQKAAMNALAQINGEPIPFEHD